MSLFALIFQSHAVLQRDAPIPVWGFQAANTGVDVTLAGVTLSTAADASGYWRVTFPSMGAGGPFNLSGSASTGLTTSLEDILIGDVVLCSGQSSA